MLRLSKQIIEIVKYYGLLFHLAIRELKIRYKYPFLGFLWMLFVPLCMVFIFKVVFSVIIKISVPPYPFFVFLITAVFPWNYLAMSLSQATTSLVDSSNLIKKVYFPREIVPLSILLGNLFSFLLTMGLILILLPLIRIEITPLVLFLPFVIILQTLFMTGLVLMSSSLQVLYRDVKYIVEIILLLWFYLTPVFYPLSLVEGISTKFLRIYMLNPLACLVTVYRLILLPGFNSTLPEGITVSYLVNYTVLTCVCLFMLGLFVFRRYDRRISDFV